MAQFSKRRCAPRCAPRASRPGGGCAFSKRAGPRDGPRGALFQQHRIEARHTLSCSCRSVCGGGKLLGGAKAGQRSSNAASRQLLLKTSKLRGARTTDACCLLGVSDRPSAAASRSDCCSAAVVQASASVRRGQMFIACSSWKSSLQAYGRRSVTSAASPGTRWKGHTGARSPWCT